MTGPPCAIIAGVSSGVGKTTVTAAIVAALARRGLTVQPFKTGPDFIDPGFLAAAAGRPCGTLDGWMMSPAELRALFARRAAGADLAVIEGVMGLHDGVAGDDDRGSAADLARLLEAPVVLVLDARAMARSAAAVALGFQLLDPSVRVVGVIANQVASSRHARLVAEAVASSTGLIALGSLPRRDTFALPSRHLGLVGASELTGGSVPDLRAALDALARQAEETLDLDGIIAVARSAPPLACESSAGPAEADRGRSGGREAPALTAFGAAWGMRAAGRRAAVAWDAAFAFAYADTLDALRHVGAAVEPFSPLADEPVPDGADFVYVPGGYPELHGATLAAGRHWQASLARHLARGGRLYAECGGLMALGRELVDLEGRAYPMAGLLPIRTVMGRRRTALGYVEVIVERDNLLGPAGRRFRGHEFHYSTLEPAGEALLAATTRLTRARPTTGGEGTATKPDGYAAPGLLAGYAHLPLALYPEALLRLLGAEAPAAGPTRQEARS